MVDQVQAEYARAGKTVIFVEHNNDDCGKNPATGQQQLCVGSRDRKSVYFVARSDATTLPLMMSDSGAKTHWGSSQDWARQLKSMVDPELRRMEQADIRAYFQRSGNTATVQAFVTNKSGRELSQLDNARVWVLLYEDAKVTHTGHFVRAVKSTLITPELADGATGEYQIDNIAGTGGMNWAKAHLMVFVDARKPNNGIYDMMQAAEAVEGAPPSPTVEATPTEVAPTETATPTETPPVTTEPSPTATIEPTETPGPMVFLPIAYFNWALDR